MKISAIVATGPKREIGNLGKMPWSYPSEYQHFIQTVSGHYIMMGRINWEENSTNKRLLSRVSSLVLTSQKNYILNHQIHSDFDVLAFSKLEVAINFAKNQGEKELFIIGGEQLYKLAMPFVDRIYYSVVPYQGRADTFFPEIEMDQFKITEEKNYNATSDSPKWQLQILDRR